jgi:hypothetical protein
MTLHVVWFAIVVFRHRSNGELFSFARFAIAFLSGGTSYLAPRRSVSFRTPFALGEHSRGLPQSRHADARRIGPKE